MLRVETSKARRHIDSGARSYIHRNDGRLASDAVAEDNRAARDVMAEIVLGTEGWGLSPHPFFV